MDDQKQSELSALRDKIEEINGRVLELLNARASLVDELGELKLKLGMNLYDPLREARQLQALLLKNRGPMSNSAMEQIFKEIFRTALNQQIEKGKKQALLATAHTGEPACVNVAGQTIGGGKPVVIAGPCSVEHEDYLDQVAQTLKKLGVAFIRGGAFKPRTSPYAFQGLGLPGLRVLSAVGKRHGLRVVSELTDICQIEATSGLVDMIQVGARNMFNYELLKKLGQLDRPILLKRSFAATVDELFLACEYLFSEGNRNVVLCERGIRTFETATRNTLDLSAVSLIKETTDLPVVVDVSHAAGRRDLLPRLAAASLAAGADGIMVEVHPHPESAMSDGSQQLNLEEFGRFMGAIEKYLA
jgi:3-deoxy-7-phosphoheptulonate synthase/chorismate mutase